MDEVYFLIIEFFSGRAYFNRETLNNGYLQDARFIGHPRHHITNQFERMIEQGLLMPMAGQQNVLQHQQNFILTDKGREAYEDEKAKRQQKSEAEILQRQMSISVINTNNSVFDTNESVRTTNSSIQDLNRVSRENFKTQNRIAISSVIAAIAAVIVSIFTLRQGYTASDNSKIIDSLSQDNRLITRENLRLRDSLTSIRIIDSLKQQNLILRDSLQAKDKKVN